MPPQAGDLQEHPPTVHIGGRTRDGQGQPQPEEGAPDATTSGHPSRLFEPKTPSSVRQKSIKCVAKQIRTPSVVLPTERG